MRDHSRIMESDARVIGVSPSLYNTAHKLVEKIDFQNLTTALSLTEQLYTARGSQSAGQGSMVAKMINVEGNSEKTFLLE
jgi:hypothetical protein